MTALESQWKGVTGFCDRGPSRIPGNPGNFLTHVSGLSRLARTADDIVSVFIILFGFCQDQQSGSRRLRKMYQMEQYLLRHSQRFKFLE